MPQEDWRDEKNEGAEKEEMIGAFIFGMFFLILLVAALFILLFVFWIKMLIDSIKRDFKNENEKIVWVLVIVLLGLLGAAIYYFVVKANDKKNRKKK